MSFTCPHCNLTSHHPMDAQHGYCARCHVFVKDIPLPPEPCPECAAGKHPNCDSAAWNFTTDMPCACPCWVRQHIDEVIADKR